MHWEQLEPHLPCVYRFALRLTEDTNLAEDLTQDVVLRAWKKRRQLKKAPSLRVWLFRITVNLWRDQLRSKQTMPAMQSDADIVLESEMPPPDAVAIHHEDTTRVFAAIAGLPPRQRQVMHLFAVEGLNIAQIADVLDMRHNAARGNLCEARRKLRHVLNCPDQSAPAVNHRK